MIKLFSTYTKDIILNKGIKTISKGGPALFMENVFSEGGVGYEIYAQKAVVEIIVKDNDEKGVLQNSLNRQQIKKVKKGDIIVISTVADEWFFSSGDAEGARVFLDAQGYVRYAKENSKFYEENFWDNIFCLKVNKQELSQIPSDVINNQKRKCLIVTKGNDGVEIHSKNKKYFFKGNDVEPVDTIGAGDTFFANFIVSFIKTDGMIEKSCNIAMNKVEKFLLNKK